MEEKQFRKCGECRRLNVPFGIEWPFWKEGKPLCIQCQNIETARAAMKQLAKEVEAINGRTS